MKLELSNLESLKKYNKMSFLDDEIFVLSHAPYDVFHHIISSHMAEYLPTSPILKFNTFGNVIPILNEAITIIDKKNLVYLFNWADLFPYFELNSRHGNNLTQVKSEEVIEQIIILGGILDEIHENPNVNLLVILPDLNESNAALGHILEKNLINSLYLEFVNLFNKNNFPTEYKTGKQDLNNYFKYHIYDDLKGIISISQLIASHFYKSDYRVKAIFVDLDDTIWPSNIGDWQEFPIISEHINNRFYCLQTILKNLSANGVLLIAISKNDSEYVLENFDKIKMPLKQKDFYSINCSWDQKSGVIGRIVEEINILDDHCLFLDDNPAELLEVNSRLPNLKSFRVSKEVPNTELLFQYLRTQLVTSSSKRENAARRIIRKKLVPESDKSYLIELDLKISQVWLNNLDGRPFELINKTNQFNLNGIRLLNSNLSGNTKAFKIDLSDKYGDFGTIGAIVFSDYETELVLRSFVLSCRAFSRGVEIEMLHILLKYALGRPIVFEYIRTDRNKVINDFLKTITQTIDNKLYLSEKSLKKIRLKYKGVLNV